MTTPHKDKRFAVAQGRKKTSWEAIELHEVHHQVKRRIFLGQKNTEIANVLGITKEQVSSIRNSPVVQEQLKLMQTKADDEVISIKEEVSKLAPRAVQLMSEIMNDENVPANVQLSAAKDVLDRSGNAAPQQVNHLHGHFTAEDLDSIKSRATKLALENGNIIDVEEV